MEELAVQAANDINSDEDRKSIDDEIQQLKEEMGTVFDKTAFNGRKIWEINEVTGTWQKRIEALTMTNNSRILSNYEAGYSDVLGSTKIEVAGTDNNNLDTYGFYLKDGHNRFISRLISWDEINYYDCNIETIDYVQTELDSINTSSSSIFTSICWNADSRIDLDEIADALNGRECVSTTRINVWSEGSLGNVDCGFQVSGNN